MRAKSVWTIPAALVGGLILSSTVQAKRIDIRWVLIHEPSLVVEQAAKDFATRLETESSGDLHVEVLTRSQYSAKYNHGKPLSHTEAMRKVNDGSLEMCQTYTNSLGSQAPSLWALSLPYLFRDYDHAEKVIEGPIGRHMLAELQKSSDMRGLAITYSGGYGIFATTGRQARRPEDLQGLRTMLGPGPVFDGFAERLHLQPVKVSAAKFAEIAANGGVDAAETTPARFEELGYQRSAKVAVLTDHFLVTTMIVMNKNFFKSLPPKYQQLVERIAVETARTERQQSINANRIALEKMREQGVQVIELTPAEKQRFVEALKPVYSMTAAAIDKHWAEDIRNVRSGPVTAQR